MNIRTKSATGRGRLLAAAAIAIGAAGLPLVAGADDQAKQTSERTAQPENPGGAKAADQEVVSQALAKVVSAATSQQAGAGGIQGLVDCFYEPDRQRFAALMQADQVREGAGAGAAAGAGAGPAVEGRRLADAVARLGENFQTKYNRPLNFGERGALGNEFVRVGGQIEAGARTAGSRIESTAQGGTSSSSSSSSSASASVTADGKTSSVSTERSSENSSSKSGGTSSSSSSATASGSSEKASDKGSGTSGTGAAGGGASGSGPASSTDAAGAARPSQGNIAQRQDAGGGTSGSASTGTREKLSEQISGGDSGRSASAAAGARADLPNSVTATIPANRGLPAVVVSLVREGNDWKINVPDTLSPQRLAANLARNLNAASQQRDQWPDDPKQAQQVIAHQVLMAIMDRNAGDAR